MRCNPRPCAGRRRAPLFGAALAAVLAVSASQGANICGTDYTDAAKCTVACPLGVDSECPSGERCWKDVVCSEPVPTPSASSAPSETPAAADPKPTGENYCGTKSDFGSSCKTPCPDGLDSECSYGETCFAKVQCAPTASRTPTSTPEAPAPVEASPAPEGAGGAEATGRKFCGKDFSDAEKLCDKACPNGVDRECPDGLKCFQTQFCVPASPTPSAAPKTLGAGKDDEDGKKLSTLEIVGVVSGVIGALIAVEEAVRRCCKPRRRIEELPRDGSGFT